MTSYLPPKFSLSPEVSHALKNNLPIVALESTILTHGLPHPTNLHCAQTLEKTILQNGATPATVAIINGIPHVGLSSHHLTLLTSPHTKVHKIALRDLPLAYTRSLHGGTTVSATMAISSAVGIPIFATGGIGGIHRGVQHTFDISADILALARFPQLVVCAGVKAILDIPKTLQALETASVPVLVFRHDYFPAFYTRGSLPAPVRVESEHEVARVLQATGNNSAVLLAVPVPREYEAESATVEQATQIALKDLSQQQPPVLPQQVTPFLLDRIANLTAGASVKANVHLAQNNARVAARVAVQLSQLRSNKDAHHLSRRENRSDVIVLGGVALDIICDSRRDTHLQLGVSNRGTIRQSLGGVGRNVAQAARHAGACVTFFSAVGNDPAGTTVLARMRELGWDAANILTRSGRRTSCCCVVHNDKGDLTVAIGDMDDVFETAALVSTRKKDLEQALTTAKIACMDANLSTQDMHSFATLCATTQTPLWFEPTTPEKCARIVESGALRYVTYLSPNESELKAMASTLDNITNATAKGVSQMAETVLRKGGSAKSQCLLVTRGSLGVSRFRLTQGYVTQTDFPAQKVNVVNTVGAGDCFAGACLAALARGVEEDEAIKLGILAATKCCLVEDSAALKEQVAKL